MSNEINTLMCLVHHFLSNKLNFIYAVYISRSRSFSEKKYDNASRASCLLWIEIFPIFLANIS